MYAETEFWLTKRQHLHKLMQKKLCTLRKTISEYGRLRKTEFHFALSDFTQFDFYQDLIIIITYSLNDWHCIHV